MSVVSTDLKLYAAANMPNDDTSLNGGAIDVGAEITGALDEVFKDAYSKETGGGDRIVYRKVFLKNTNGATTLSSVKVWMSADEHDYITLDLESSVDGSDTSTNRITAPAGYSFGEHASEEAAHALPGDGNLDAGEAIGVWLKKTIPENQAPDASITATLKIKGTTT